MISQRKAIRKILYMNKLVNILMVLIQIMFHQVIAHQVQVIMTIKKKKTKNKQKINNKMKKNKKILQKILVEIEEIELEEEVPI